MRGQSSHINIHLIIVFSDAISYMGRFYVRSKVSVYGRIKFR